MTDFRMPPRLLSRLRHLLLTEGYGHREQAGIRARTVRHLIALGPAALGPLVRDFPEIQALVFWSTLRPLIAAGDAPSGTDGDSLDIVFEEELLDPEQDDEAAIARQFLRRMVYLLNREFPACPLGYIGMSVAYRGLRQLRLPYTYVIEAYLDCTDPQEMQLYRFLLYNFGAIKNWQEPSEAELFQSIAEFVDQYPYCMGNISPAQLSRFARKGILSPAFVEAFSNTGEP